MALTGALIAAAGAPQVGLPLALYGAVFEAAAPFNVLALLVKSASLNVVASTDAYGNVYLGGQASVGKSSLPMVSLGLNPGEFYTQNRPMDEGQMRQAMSGFSLSAGSIVTGGISYSLSSSANQVSYYGVAPPEIFSANAQLSFWALDFAP